MRATLARMSGFLGILAATMGLTSVLGRLLTSAESLQHLPSLFAAVAICLCGSALAFVARGSGSRNTRMAGSLALTAMMLALVNLGVNAVTALDQLHPVMMASVSALLVLIVASAVIFVQRPDKVTLGQGLALAGLTMAGLALIGYVEGLEILASPFPIRLFTALLLGVIAIGILCARPDHGPMKVVTSATSAGRVARRLMLPLVLLPVLLNILFHRMPEWAWRITPEMNNAMFIFSSMLIIAALAWWQVLTLHRFEQGRRRFEERELQAQGQYELVVQNATDYAIYTLDPGGYINSWNAGAEQLRGYRVEKIVGQPYSKLISNQNGNGGKARRLLDQARRDGRVVTEGWEARKDGSQFYAHSVLTRMSDPRGRLLGFTKISRDITIQKEVEDEQTKLQSILNTVVDPLIVIDSEGVIETFNPAAERVFGYQASEVMHRNVSLLMPLPTRKEHDGYLHRYGKTREPRVIGNGRDIEAQRKDGSVFPAELSVSEMWVQGRQKFTGIVRDISARKAAEEALQRSERRLNLALEAGNIGVWDMDIESELVIATGPLFDSLIVPGDNSAKLSTWIALNHPDDRIAMQEQFDQIVRGDREVMELEHRLQNREGDWYWLFTRSSVSRVGQNGKALSMHGVTVDIHQRKVTEEALRKSKLDMEMAIRDADFHLWHLDVTTFCLTDLDELLETLGYGEVANTHSVDFWRSLMHPEDLAQWSRSAMLPLPDALQEDGLELRLRAKDGSWRWLITRARVTETDSNGQPTLISGTCIDITSRKQSAEQLLHAAQHDPLTGLPNRALTYALGEHLLESAPRHGQRSAVLFVDLDRFKPINDYYGHATGDTVLQEVANRLKKCVRTEDVVGRLGGDEFLVILAQVGRVNDISKVAAKCLAEVSRPITHKDLELGVSPSIGISLFPADGCDMDALVKHADVAMYHAKQNGRNQFRFFTSAMNKQAKSLLKFEARMRRAIDRQGFCLHYQPIVDTEMEKTTGVEALLRWPAARLGPDEFIPLAESSGLILPLGDWVLQEACRQQVAWSDQGMEPLRMSVNVSPVQFRQRQFRERVGRIIDQTGIDPTYLQLEITENALLHNADQVVHVLNELRAMGLSIALDDFGKGYSSLNYLKSLPLDVVKVDKDFIHELGTDRVNLAITEAIIGLSERLGLQVIAEGIESEAVLQLLREKRCRHMQGYYLSRPLEAAVFEAWCLDPIAPCKAWQH